LKSQPSEEAPVPKHSLSVSMCVTLKLEQHNHIYTKPCNEELILEGAIFKDCSIQLEDFTSMFKGHEFHRLDSSMFVVWTEVIRSDNNNEQI